MPEIHLRRLVDRLRTAAGPGGDHLPTDGELLDHYVRRRDQSAFELLVRRHGGLVLGVCRRVLRDTHAAEDAFQATFLILACKARSVRQPTIAGWLHRVALRIALRARRFEARRTTRELPLLEEPAVEAVDYTAGSDLRSVLDDELARLPERMRLPVLLCYVEGHTTAQAARLLGCPRGTVLSRLATARQRLGIRLAKRGLGLAAAGVAAGLAESAASGAVSAALVLTAVQNALSSPLGKAGSAGAVSARTINLARGVLHAMFIKKLVCVVGALLVLGTLTAAVGWVAAPTPAGAREPSAAKAAAQGPEKLQTDTKEADRSAQLERARNALAQQERLLGEVEEQWSQPLLEARKELIKLEEKQRATERERDAALDKLQRMIKRDEPEGLPEVVELRKYIAALTDRIEKIKDDKPKPEGTQLEWFQEQLQKKQDQLHNALLNAEKRLSERESVVRTTEKEFGGALLLVRVAMLAAEEKVQRLERRRAREIARATAEVDAAAARVHQTAGVPFTPQVPNHAGSDLDRKLDELLREVADIKRDLKRPREGK